MLRGSARGQSTPEGVAGPSHKAFWLSGVCLRATGGDPQRVWGRGVNQTAVWERPLSSVCRTDSSGWWRVNRLKQRAQVGSTHSPSHGGTPGNGEAGVALGTGEHQLHLFCDSPCRGGSLLASSFLFW